MNTIPYPWEVDDTALFLQDAIQEAALPLAAWGVLFAAPIFLVMAGCVIILQLGRSMIGKWRS